MSWFKKNPDPGLQFPPAKQKSEIQNLAAERDESLYSPLPPVGASSQNYPEEVQPPLRQNLSPEELNLIVQKLKTGVVEDIIHHPLFLTSLAHELEKRDELHLNVVKKCLESLEAKYDITPTQIYRDKITTAQSTLESLNTGIEKQSEVFNSFKDALAELQQQSSQEYQKNLNHITTSILEKFKL